MAEPIPGRARRVVIIGGGFGGLYAAQGLSRANVEVTLIDRRNFHLFQPLLYQVATGGLSPANIAAPLRSILSRQKNVRVILGEVTDFALTTQEVVLADGERIPFDDCILATGATHHYFGRDDWEPLAPGLKTLEDATEIRRRVLGAFEIAERMTDAQARQAWLTFVIVGGGPTGVELAGTISELARVTMRRDFRSFDPATCQVILVEGQPRILGSFPEKLSAYGLKAIQELGIQVRLGRQVTDITPEAVQLRELATGQMERLATRTVLWAAGVKATPLNRKLAEAIGPEAVQRLGRAGHWPVNPDCSLADYPQIYAIGDCASYPGADGQPLPGVAPVAMQQGKYVARVLAAKAAGRPHPGPFRYWDKGSMATIGRNRAVAVTNGFKLTGFLAWLAWLFIHVLYLAKFSNRVLVSFQWFWNYVTRNRSARLITGVRTPMAQESLSRG